MIVLTVPGTSIRRTLRSVEAAKNFQRLGGFPVVRLTFIDAVPSEPTPKDPS